MYQPIPDTRVNYVPIWTAFKSSFFLSVTYLKIIILAVICDSKEVAVVFNQTIPGSWCLL